jgi:multiple sugar transport system substrate-binding protein
MRTLVDLDGRLDWTSGDAPDQRRGRQMTNVYRVKGLLPGLCLLALAAGCSDGDGLEPVQGTGGSGTGGAGGSGMTTGGTGGVSMAPVTLKFWRHDNMSYRKATDDAFADYRAIHPNVTIVDSTVDWHTYTSRLAADLKRDQFDFDLVLMPPAQLCGYADNLLEVPAALSSLSEAQNTFFRAPLEASTCGGKLKGLPMEYNLEYGGVVVNVDKYQAKFPGKTPSWPTWAAFIAEAAALSEFDDSGKPCVNGLDIDPDWPEPARHILLSMILQRNGYYWSKTDPGLFDFNTPEARESLAEMVKWMTVDHVMSPALVPDKNTYVTSRLAKGATGFGCGTDVSAPLSVMGYAGTWAVKDVNGQVPASRTVRYEFFPLPPMVGNEHKFIQNAGFALAVPKTSRNAAVAWDVARSLALSPEAMRKWAATAGTLPALKANGTEAAGKADPQLAKVQPLLEKGAWMGYIPSASTEAVLGAMVSNYFAVVKGTKSVEKALEDMQNTANTSIVQNR